MRSKRRWYCLSAVLAIIVTSTALVMYSAVLWSADARRPLMVSRETLAQMELRTPQPPPQVPRLIHQTWKNATVPEQWVGAQGTIFRDHPASDGWEYRLWTDAATREFIAAEYPHLLATFDSYSLNIQRADSMRYIILYHFGGIYMDMDVGCMRSLEPMLSFPAVLPNTVPIGFSNDFMMARPRHPFFLQAMNALPTWNHWYIGPWLTAFFSAGPPFLSIQYISYIHSQMGGADLQSRIDNLHPDLVYNMATDLYGAGKYFLQHFPGNSWLYWDSVLVGVIYNNFSLRVFMLASMTLLLSVYICCRCRHRASRCCAARFKHHHVVQPQPTTKHI